MQTQTISLVINDAPCRFEVSPQETLLEVIRERAGLKGAKRGCDCGQCGACTVLLNGKSVYSCCVLAVSADGARVETVESLSKDGRPHPIQEAFIEQNAIQCGFCTPGMELSAKALLDVNPNPTAAEIKEALAGNICRCTGYVKIEAAVRAAAAKMGGSND